MGCRKNILGKSGRLQNPKQTTSYGNSLRQPQKLGWALVLAQNRIKAAGGKWKSGKSSNQPTCGLFTSDPV
jgi:hypothetical protein